MQATYCFACNLLLSLPPPAFLKNNNLKMQRNPVRWRFCIWRATSFKCERARREGEMGVELGRRCLLLPPPPPPRRLGEEGGGQSGRRGGWVLLCNFSPGASTRRRLQTGPPRRCGGGGPPARDSPPAQSMYAPTPFPALPSLKPPQRACLAVRPYEGPRRRCTVSVQPCSLVRSDTLRSTRPGGGGADHPRGSAAGRAPAPPASPLSPAGALTVAAEGPGELRTGSGVAELGWGGKEQREEKLEKLGFPPKPAPERPGRPPPPPPLLSPGG